MPAFDIVRRWMGRTVLDRTGRKIGTIVDVFYDAEADEPGWGLLNVADIGVELRLVPLAGTVEVGARLRVPHDQLTVVRAPGMELEGRLFPQEQADLYAYYGLAFTAASLAELDEAVEEDDPVIEDLLGAARLRRRVRASR